jgi:putative nucleotidyltransferase with HDIG domain
MAASERILFIDDELSVRVAFARTLRRHGFDIDLAGNREEAITLAAQTSYAVIATDYRMPDIDGLTLAGELQEIQPQAVFVLISGECDMNLAIQAVNEHGMAFLVTKPWVGDELRAVMARAIAAHQEKALQAQVQQSVVGHSRAYEEQKNRLQEALSRSELFLAEILLNALDLRSHETRAHCRRVATYSRMLAESMKLQGTALQSIYQGALLHDVGKIGVPDSILLKPGALDPNEWEIMRQHPIMGAKLLEGFGSLAGARELVIQHHERFDGTGYPVGLAGNGICIGARVFAVADALEAMLSKRPYREAMSYGAAEKQIVVNGGTQFDPQVVEAFLRVTETEWLAVRDEFVDEPPVISGSGPTPRAA